MENSIFTDTSTVSSVAPIENTWSSPSSYSPNSGGMSCEIPYSPYQLVEAISLNMRIHHKCIVGLTVS